LTSHLWRSEKKMRGADKDLQQIYSGLFTVKSISTRAFAGEFCDTEAWSSRKAVIGTRTRFGPRSESVQDSHGSAEENAMQDDGQPVFAFGSCTLSMGH